MNLHNELLKLRDQAPQTKKLNDDQLFVLLCLSYFHLNGELTNNDIASYFTDGQKEGGIDYVYFDPETDSPATVWLGQSKLIKSVNSSEDLLSWLKTPIKTWNSFVSGHSTCYNEQLRRILRTAVDFTSDSQVDVNVELFIGCELSDDRKRKLKTFIETDPALASEGAAIYDMNDIVRQVNEITEPKHYVQSAKIRIDEANNVLRYKKNGIVVNVSANGLKKLFERYNRAGLLDQNLRYFIRNKKIDDSIRSTITNHSDQFWYLNNGVIIGCNEFQIDGNEVRLEQFSIINGGQTTYNLGQSEHLTEASDFSVQCKIISSVDDNKTSRSFLDSIAEATNSQKPINARDLKSNAPEQLEIKKDLATLPEPLNMVIKRGEKKNKSFDKRHTLNNQHYGQVVTASILQHPEISLSQMTKIFSVDSLYQRVFLHQLEPESFSRLYAIYQEFLHHREEDAFGATGEVMNFIVQYGHFHILAALVFLLATANDKPTWSRVIYMTENPISSSSWTLPWSKLLRETANTGKLPTAAVLRSQESYFRFLVQTVNEQIATGYKNYSTTNPKAPSVINFLKTSSSYTEGILNHLIAHLQVEKYFKEVNTAVTALTK